MRCLAVLLCLAALCAAELSKAQTKQIRDALARYLAEPSAKARGKIASEIETLGTVAEIEAVLRMGPTYPKGKPKARKGETLVEVRNTVVGYSFRYDRETYRYAVDIPRGYDASRAHPVLLDPGHGTGAKQDAKGKAEFLPFFRRHADEAGGRDWLVVRSEIVEQIGADRKNLPEEYGARVFQEMFRDLATRFHIDPDRIYVAGLSQTGFWTWMLGRARADRFAGLVPMSAVTWEVNGYPANFLNVPVYVLHGAKDPVCPVSQPRRTCPALVRQGVDLKYHEIPTGKHDGSVWRLSTGLKWLADKPRRRYPKRVSKSLQTVHDGWCYWLRIDRIEKEGDGRAGSKPTAGLDGEIDGQTLRLYGDGVSAATIGLASEMLDLDQPVTVFWNGRQVYQGKPARSVATMLELIYDKADWRATFEAVLTVKAP